MWEGALCAAWQPAQLAVGVGPWALWQPSQRPPWGESAGQVRALVAACAWHDPQRWSASRAGRWGAWHEAQSWCAAPRPLAWTPAWQVAHAVPRAGTLAWGAWHWVQAPWWLSVGAAACVWQRAQAACAAAGVAPWGAWQLAQSWCGGAGRAVAVRTSAAWHCAQREALAAGGP